MRYYQRLEYEILESLGGRYPVCLLCRVMGVNRSGYYKWKARKAHPSERHIHAPFLFPKDILDALRKDPIVWQHYNAFTESYKRIRVAYIDSARNRPEEFEKRLRNFLEKTKQNKLIIGYGGIEKYYQ